jgi:hypothetical protein
VPTVLIEVYPQYRGRKYFVYKDETIIVDDDMRIVAVLTVRLPCRALFFAKKHQWPASRSSRSKSVRAASDARDLVFEQVTAPIFLPLSASTSVFIQRRHSFPSQAFGKVRFLRVHRFIVWHALPHICTRLGALMFSSLPFI